jgi:hypothetical protein
MPKPYWYPYLELDPGFTDDVAEHYKEFDRKNLLHMLTVDTDYALIGPKALFAAERLKSLPTTTEAERQVITTVIEDLEKIDALYQHSFVLLATYKS